MSELKELQSKFDTFRMEGLQRLTRLETKIERMEEYDDELHEDILALRDFMMKKETELCHDIDDIRANMPNSTTYKIIFGVFGATLSLMCAMILIFFR